MERMENQESSGEEEENRSMELDDTVLFRPLAEDTSDSEGEDVVRIFERLINRYFLSFNSCLHLPFLGKVCNIPSK
jgi:hypothetical protein